MRDQISHYIRAGYSGLYLVSHEEQRVEAEIKAVATGLQHGLFAWSITEGLICVLCCMETCPSFKLLYGKEHPRLINARRPQRVLYFYLLDPNLGLIYIRLATWFPFTVQVYVNGHSWLAQQMLKKRLGFNLQDNAFTALEDPEATQKLADSFATLNWTKILDRLIRDLHPLMKERWFRGLRYYWVVDQAEYATDLIFTSREALAGLYSRLLDHAAVNFSAKDILSFLGRRFHPRFEGEVLTNCQKGRWPGARIKHRMKNNWLKMYDKFGWILRIETVINDPREFRVRRLRTREGRRQMVWCPMNKGVINLYRYHEVSLAANRRYLDALAVVDDPTPAYQQVAELTEPVMVSGRSHAGFNPASAEQVRLFQTVLDGDHLLRGFRNGEIRAALYGTTEDDAERRRQSHAVGRMLKRLHVRGMILKVPHSHRWHVSEKGHRILGAIVRLYHDGIPAAVARAA